jgi:hypothetical protein
MTQIFVSQCTVHKKNWKKIAIERKLWKESLHQPSTHVVNTAISVVTALLVK